MIKLSDRLRRIAEDINSGETMADIGTDHGFLPVYLRQVGICPRVIMTDISAASLEKAVSCARAWGVLPDSAGAASAGSEEPAAGECAEGEVTVEFRTGDGLSVLRPFEVDTVVIAGMGGKLIRDIMAEEPELTYSFRKYILQPRIGQGHLRKWLTDHGFVIVREGLVKEGRHIPEIITAISPRFVEDGNPCIRERAKVPGDVPAESMLWRIPPWMVFADGPVEEFLLRNLSRERETLDNMKLARRRDVGAELGIMKNIKYLDELMKEYKNGK